MCFQFDKGIHTRQPSKIDQENAESQGKRVLISITFAQCQGRYARNQNVWYWSPQTTGHVCLHKFIRFGRTMCSAMNKQVLNSPGTQTIIMNIIAMEYSTDSVSKYLCEFRLSPKVNKLIQTNYQSVSQWNTV